MTFRERPEYQQWRQAVFSLFGESCILCGHPRNTHVHHVLPVRTYPELAFDPHNGVPLCGNCHSDVTGDELAYVEELQIRQQEVLGGEAATGAGRAPTAEPKPPTDPGDTEAVDKWVRFFGPEPRVLEYLSVHQGSVEMTAWVCAVLAHDALRTGDRRRFVELLKRLVSRCATTDESLLLEVLAVIRGVADETGHSEHLERSFRFLHASRPKDPVIAFQLWRLLPEPSGKASPSDESMQLLGQAASGLPKNYDVQCCWAFELLRTNPREAVAAARRALALAMVDSERYGALCALAHGLWRTDSKDEALKAWERGIPLSDNPSQALSNLGFHYLQYGDHKKALDTASSALDLAQNEADRSEALLVLAAIYSRSELYSDAIAHIREVLRRDPHHLRALRHLMHCLFMTDKRSQGEETARKILLLDPSDELAQEYLKDARRERDSRGR